MKKSGIVFLIIIVSILSLSCLFTGSRSSTTQDTPEEAVRGFLKEASQGDEDGMYRYVEDGIDNSRQWPGDFLYYCRGINMDKKVYQTENYSIKYKDDEHANVTIKTSLLFSGTIKTVKIDDKWYMSHSDPSSIREICKQ